MGNGLIGRIPEMEKHELDSNFVICFQCYTNQSPFKHLSPCPVMEAQKRLRISIAKSEKLCLNLK